MRRVSGAESLLCRVNLWDYDTAREYKTVNGVPGRGGAFDVAGPVIAGGMLFAVSGYPGRGGQPGNVLLAFAVER